LKTGFSAAFPVLMNGFGRSVSVLMIGSLPELADAWFWLSFILAETS
jgi:hypothetical protein